MQKKPMQIFAAFRDYSFQKISKTLGLTIMHQYYWISKNMKHWGGGKPKAFKL